MEQLCTNIFQKLKILGSGNPNQSWTIMEMTIPEIFTIKMLLTVCWALQKILNHFNRLMNLVLRLSVKTDLNWFSNKHIHNMNFNCNNHIILTTFPWTGFRNLELKNSSKMIHKFMGNLQKRGFFLYFHTKKLAYSVKKNTLFLHIFKKVWIWPETPPRDTS